MRGVGVGAVAALLISGVALAGEPPLQVSYPTDGNLDCAGLDGEIARMDSIMGVSSDQAAKAQGSAQAAELGASAAINGALYSGALGRAPGLGLFGNAAAGLAKQRAAAKEAEAKETIRTAETRRAMLMGMYAGKGCNVPQPAAEEVAPAPAPEPVLPDDAEVTASKAAWK